MAVASVVREEQSSDARLALGLASVCAVSFPLFVLWPYAAGNSWQPPGADALWGLAMVFSVLIGPVAAGLAGWASLSALWTRRAGAAAKDAMAAPGHAAARRWPVHHHVDRQERRRDGVAQRLTLRTTACRMTVLAANGSVACWAARMPCPSGEPV